MSRLGIEPRTRRLRDALVARNNAIFERFPRFGLQTVAMGGMSVQPLRNRLFDFDIYRLGTPSSSVSGGTGKSGHCFT